MINNTTERYVYTSVANTLTFQLGLSSTKNYQSHRKRKTWTKNTGKVCKFSSLHCLTVFYLKLLTYWSNSEKNLFYIMAWISFSFLVLKYLYVLSNLEAWAMSTISCSMLGRNKFLTSVKHEFAFILIALDIVYL